MDDESSTYIAYFKFEKKNIPGSLISQILMHLQALPGWSKRSESVIQALLSRPPIASTMSTMKVWSMALIHSLPAEQSWNEYFAPLSCGIFMATIPFIIYWCPNLGMSPSWRKYINTPVLRPKLKFALPTCFGIKQDNKEQLHNS